MSDARNELSEEKHDDKAKECFGKGRPGRKPQGKGTQEDCSAMWLTASGFMVMGSVSGLSVVNRSHSEPFQRWIPERKILRGWSDMWSVPSLSF